PTEPPWHAASQCTQPADRHQPCHHKAIATERRLQGRSASSPCRIAQRMRRDRRVRKQPSLPSSQPHQHPRCRCSSSQGKHPVLQSSPSSLSIPVGGGPARAGQITVHGMARGAYSTRDENRNSYPSYPIFDHPDWLDRLLPLGIKL